MVINLAFRKWAHKGCTVRWDKCSTGGEKRRERDLVGLPGGSRFFCGLEERALISLYKGKLGNRRAFKKKAATRNGGPMGPQGVWMTVEPIAPVPNLQKRCTWASQWSLRCLQCTVPYATWTFAQWTLARWVKGEVYNQIDGHWGVISLTGVWNPAREQLVTYPDFHSSSPSTQLGTKDAHSSIST